MLLRHMNVQMCTNFNCFKMFSKSWIERINIKRTYFIVCTETCSSTVILFKGYNKKTTWIEYLCWLVHWRPQSKEISPRFSFTAVILLHDWYIFDASSRQLLHDLILSLIIIFLYQISLGEKSGFLKMETCWKPQGIVTSVVSP